MNIMAVAHGTEKPVVLAHKAAIDAHLEAAGIPVSYTNVFWGGRSEIKPSEIAGGVRGVVPRHGHRSRDDARALSAWRASHRAPATEDRCASSSSCIGCCRSRSRSGAIIAAGSSSARRRVRTAADHERRAQRLVRAAGRARPHLREDGAALRRPRPISSRRSTRRRSRRSPIRCRRCRSREIERVITRGVRRAARRAVRAVRRRAARRRVARPGASRAATTARKS